MSETRNAVHVAVGVIVDQQDHVLIARRPEHLHQGGLWEFPGGKLEGDETVEQALRRELFEELGIEVIQAHPLIKVTYDYGDKLVLLDTYVIKNFAGKAYGKEGQEITWVPRSALDNFMFPAANVGIVRAVQLPSLYMITPEYPLLDDYVRSIDRAVNNGIRLIQFRAKHLTGDIYTRYAKALVARYQDRDVSLIINAPENLLEATGAAGWHLTSTLVQQYQSRPIPEDSLLSASVHNLSELEQSKQLGVDFVVISPVRITASHPDAVPLGWSKFAELANLACVPVYALGGLTRADLAEGRRYGAQGVAGISMFI